MKRLPAVLTIAAVSATVFILLKDDSLDQAKLDCIGWPDDPQVSFVACDVLLAEHLSDTARGNVLFYKALAHDLDEDYPTAMASYDEAATLIPQKRSIYHNRARIHFKNKAWTEVLADTDTLTTTWPDARDQNYFGALWFSAKALEKTDRPVEAVAALDRYIEGRPEKAHARRLRANLLDRHIRQFDRIDALLIQLEDLSVAMVHGPDHYKDYERRSKVLKHLALAAPSIRDGLNGLRLIDIAREEEYERKGVAQTLRDQEANFATQITETSQETFELVKDHIRDQLAAPAQDWESLSMRSMAHHMNGDVAAALKDARAALRLRPGDPVMLENIMLLEKILPVMQKIGLKPIL